MAYYSERMEEEQEKGIVGEIRRGEHEYISGQIIIARCMHKPQRTRVKEYPIGTVYIKVRSVI